MKQFLLAAVCLFGLAGLAVAAPRIEAEPNKDYHVAADSGLWFICAASYRGEHAKDLARELVLEIRRKYNMPAYIFDRGGEEHRKQFEEVQRIRQLCPEGRVKVIRIEEQFAVLVGGYKDMAAARKALDDFKKQPPPDKKFCDRGVTQQIGKNAEGKEGVITKELVYNPFLSAFVARNPTVPAEKEGEDGKPDPFLKKLNSGESLSLLNNPKPWTLTVKVFGGRAMIQERNASSNNKFMEMLGLGKSREVLDGGALQARALAETLRKMKDPSFEAYVLHTRSQSIVTVGGYDGPNDPKLVQDQKVLSRLKFPGVPPELQLFAQPLPMEVPRP